MAQHLDTLIEEAFEGFGTSQVMELDDLRLLYKGRRDVYVSFTDKGEYFTEAGMKELDRPDSIISYEVDDVVARKVSTSEFYANVFRMVSRRPIEDIRKYDARDYQKDVERLVAARVGPPDLLDIFIRDVKENVRIRSSFERLWMLTETIAKTKEDYGEKWRHLLMQVLGYTSIHDPGGSGLLILGRAPVALYLDYGNRNDLDILEIQAQRNDPRRSVRNKVEREVRRMGTRRARVARRST